MLMHDSRTCPSSCPARNFKIQRKLWIYGLCLYENDVKWNIVSSKVQLLCACHFYSRIRMGNLVWSATLFDLTCWCMHPNIIICPHRSYIQNIETSHIRILFNKEMAELIFCNFPHDFPPKPLDPSGWISLGPPGGLLACLGTQDIRMHQ